LEADSKKLLEDDLQSRMRNDIQLSINEKVNEIHKMIDNREEELIEKVVAYFKSQDKVETEGKCEENDKKKGKEKQKEDKSKNKEKEKFNKEIEKINNGFINQTRLMKDNMDGINNHICTVLDKRENKLDNIGTNCIDLENKFDLIKKIGAGSAIGMIPLIGYLIYKSFR
jgi:archaellum component FlaD/FlaE